jgi:tetratricopeptide (TPR) repeat protein
LEKEDLSTAIEKLRELITLEPEEGEFYYYLANALARDGKTDEAIQAVDMAMEKAPDDERYRRLKLSIIETNKRRSGEEAEAVIEEINKLQDAHDYEGVLVRSEQASEELADEYQALLLVQMARANAGLDRSDEAIAVYQKSVELAPAEEEFRKEFTSYLIELERYDEAFSSLETLTKMTSVTFDQALLELAKELMRKGKQAQARVAFERVLEVNPECAEAYYELGVEYYYGAQDTARAKTMLTKYLEIGKDPELLDNAKTLLKVMK